MSLKTLGLGLASVPLAGERWRIVVKDNTISPSGAELGARWYNGTGSGYFGYAADEGLATLQKGFPTSVPVAQGSFFVMDVKFPTTVPVTLPLSTLAQEWAERMGGEVVRVKKIPLGESTTDATTDRGVQLSGAITDSAPKPGAPKPKGTVGQAIDLLQLMTWAVIIGGLVYLYAQARVKLK